MVVGKSKESWEKLKVRDLNFEEVVGHINASARSYTPYPPSMTNEQLVMYMFSLC